ncbi:MAG: hypothetical protein JST20_04875 [Bacteroidetes bacterium]|nr:hypothetical protein [Bacteroidota bacterium]
MLKTTLILLAIVVMVGCTSKEEIVKLQNEKAQYAEMIALSGQKDSLMEVMENSTSTINEVYDKLLFLSGETGKAVRREGADEETSKWFSTLDSVSNVINSSKSRISDLENKILAIERQNPQLATNTNAIKLKLASMKEKCVSQETDVRKLYGDFYELRSKDSTLALSAKTTRNNTGKPSAETGAAVATNTPEPAAKFVYYCVGTEDELLKRGIVQRVGGADLWVLGKHGQTLAPAKEINPKKFNSFNVLEQSDILLLKKCKRFAVISAHNPKFLQPKYDENKKITSLHITDSDKFWLPAQFLIIVIDE